MKQFNDQLVQLWNDYTALILLSAGVVGLLALLGLLIWARKTKKELRSSALTVSMNLALMLNAEGMWVVAVDVAHLPRLFAVLVFAVFEICFLTATSLAKEQYRRTTVRADDGTIIKPGHPGPMLYIAALIAVLSGVVVASNAASTTETLLRLAVPCVIFLMWWAALVAAGQSVNRGRFAYSPRRLAERWGWLIPDDDPDLQELAAKRTVRRMVINYYRLEAGRWPVALWKWRLFKDARTADDAIVEQVRDQLTRSRTVMAMLVPAQRTDADRREQTDGQTAGQASGQTAADLSAGTEQVGPAAEQAAADRSVRSGEQVDAAAGPISADSPAAGTGQAAPDRVPAQRGQSPDGEREPEGARPNPTLPVAEAITPRSPQWRPAVERLATLLRAELRPDDGNLSGRGVSHLVQVLYPQVPVLDEQTVRDFVSDALLVRAGQGGGLSGRPWRDLLTLPPAVGSPPWRAAVTQLRDELAATVTPQDMMLSGRGARQLTAELAPRVPQLDPATVLAFIQASYQREPGRDDPSGMPWQDLLFMPHVPAGSPEWRDAVARLRDALATTLTPEDLRGQQGRGVIQLTRQLAPVVPELDHDTVQAFVGDYVLAVAGQVPEVRGPWADLLPVPSPDDADSNGDRPRRTDQELLDEFGKQLEESHARKPLTRYRVEQITGAKARQADRIREVIEQRAGRGLSATNR